MKHFLLLIVLLNTLSGCARMQGRTTPEPARQPALDPSVVERDLSRPYVPESFDAKRGDATRSDGGKP